MKKIISILLLLLFTVGCWAKDGKIKYGKCIRYEGEIVDKNPSGNGKLIIFDDVNDKKILMTIFGRFSVSSYEPSKDVYIMPITISDALVESFDTRWSYSAETTVELMIYPKLKKQKLSVTMSSPELQHPTQQIPKIISKSKINYIFNVDKNQINYSSNSSIAKPMEVKIPEFDMVLQQNFSDISHWEETKTGSFEGTVILHEDGSISDFSGDFLSEQAIYRIKSSGTNCFISEIIYKGNHFGLIDDQLFLDKVKIDNDHCKVSGELCDRSNFLYKGEYSQSGTQYNGTFILTNRESTPLDFYRGINSNSIKVKEGKLKKGDEEYEGSWDIKGAFNGKYRNKEMSYDQCTISSDGYISGEGTKYVNNSLRYKGHFEGGKMQGEGLLEYDGFDSFCGTWDNDLIVSGTFDATYYSDSYHFDIVRENDLFVYSFEGKKIGASEDILEVIRQMDTYFHQQVEESEKFAQKEDTDREKRFLNSLGPNGAVDGVCFYGKSNKETRTSSMLFSLYGIDKSYIDGEVLLVLAPEKTAFMLCKCTPTNKALSSGNASLNSSIAMICKEYFQGGWGSWSYEGNTIQITCNTENQSYHFDVIISPDKKTLTYDGFYFTKLSRINNNQIEGKMSSMLSVFH